MMNGVNEKDKKILENMLDKYEKDNDYEPTDEELETVERCGLLDFIEIDDEDEEIEEEVSINVNTENVADLSVDKKEYEKGLKEASYYVGFVSGLKSAGYPTNLIHEVILNKMNAENNIAVAKQTIINVEKQSI